MHPIYITSIFVMLFLSACSDNSNPDEQTKAPDAALGQLEHRFELNPAVQEKFEEGLLLLHNFEYEDALTAFEAATAMDSTEILTHWGEAMCHYKALWRLQDEAAGKAIMGRLGDSKTERLASIKHPVKKALWEVVEIMYGNGEIKAKNKAIKAHLQQAHQAFPNQQEIAAFYALSLVWATEEYGNGSEDLRLAAAIADSILNVNPMHPGALHYKIHALDGPTSAQEALDAADAYAKVAPDAAHALHMPSHIYLALGQWKGVVNSNRASYDASVARMQQKELKDGARGYHSLAWMHYALLQKGQYKEAETILNEMLALVPKDPTKGARGYLLGMQSRQLAEYPVLDTPTTLDLDIKVEDIGITAKSVRSMLRAQVAFKQQDNSLLQTEIDWLRTNIYMDSLNLGEGGNSMCAAGSNRYAPTENSIKMAQVVLAQMQGLQATLNTDDKQYEAAMQKAVALEAATNYPTGPPNITQPSFEQYGNWLLSQNRFEEALQQFEKALQRMPRRLQSLKGKQKALKALQREVEADAAMKELDAIIE